MKEIEELLRMTERPQDFSDEELQQLMSDPDMRAYYELMVDVREGFAHKRSEKVRVNSEKVKVKSEKITVATRLKIAAMFIGILLLSCITYAAIRIVSNHSAEQQATTSSVGSPASLREEPPTLNSQLSDTDSVRTFENAELQQILYELSAHYHVGVEFRNEQIRHIRFYTKWDTSAPLRQMIERLNGFEKVNIRLSNDQIIAE